MKTNWDRTAMRIASARYLDRQGMLDVTFEDGDHFLVAVESVLPQISHAANGRPGPQATGSVTRSGATWTPPDWSRMRIGETKDVIEAPAGDAVVEIPWDRIRSIADPEFRAHLAEQAKKRALRIGGRIRAMRLEAGLTSEALAGKVGVPREVVIDLEAGVVEPRADLIEYIAVALGRRLRDFATESFSPHEGSPDMTERQQAIYDAVTDEPKTVAEIEAASGGGRPGRGAVRHCLDWLDKVHHLVTKVGERPVRYKRRR